MVIPAQVAVQLRDSTGTRLERQLKLLNGKDGFTLTPKELESFAESFRKSTVEWELSAETDIFFAGFTLLK